MRVTWSERETHDGSVVDTRSELASNRGIATVSYAQINYDDGDLAWVDEGWEVRRIEWLSAANAANACWGGVTVAPECEPADDAGVVDGSLSPSATWATDGAIIHAPAHMGVFGKLERLRLVTEPQAAQFTSFLGTVRVTNVLLDLLNTKQLALGRISAEYAQRIVAFDYSKYETASHRIVEETLRPFGESLGVNFFDD